jgi:hypothetical protein
LRRFSRGNRFNRRSSRRRCLRLVLAEYSTSATSIER